MCLWTELSRTRFQILNLHHCHQVLQLDIYSLAVPLVYKYTVFWFQRYIQLYHIPVQNVMKFQTKFPVQHCLWDFISVHYFITHPSCTVYAFIYICSEGYGKQLFQCLNLIDCLIASVKMKTSKLHKLCRTFELVGKTDLGLGYTGSSNIQTRFVHFISQVQKASNLQS